MGVVIVVVKQCRAWVAAVMQPWPGESELKHCQCATTKYRVLEILSVRVPGTQNFPAKPPRYPSLLVLFSLHSPKHGCSGCQWRWRCRKCCFQGVAALTASSENID